MIRSRDPAWPITLLLIGYPLWWALGIADFMWIILAVPMTARMVAWRVHRSRRLRAPPAFGLWLLFLVCALAGGAVLGVTAPGTVASAISHRVWSYADRIACYIGITILLLYAGNLTESELPRRRLARMLGLMGVYAILGGIAAMLSPHFQFSSPVQLLLPSSIRSNPAIAAVVHPALAQVQNVLGSATPRPKAPFDYTNTWGGCLTVLVPWLIVGWWDAGTRRGRLLVGFVVILAGIPLLYSLNRAAWVGATLSLAVLVLLLVIRRPRALLGTVAAVVVVGVAVVVVTPLTTVVAARAAHQNSNNLRASLDVLAVRAALSSPVIGYGDTRKQAGGVHTVARGPTAKCPRCGQLDVGSTGQLWLLLVCNGFIGAILYVGFFVAGIWRFRRDRTSYGIAGILVLVLSLFYLFAYTAVPTLLGFTMLAYALLWRNEAVRRGQRIRGPLVSWDRRLPEPREMAPEPIA